MKTTGPYDGKTKLECLALMVLRKCKCGCEMEFKTLPTSQQEYARRECKPEYVREFGAVMGKVKTKNRIPCYSHLRLVDSEAFGG